MKSFGKNLITETKKDGTPVTLVDRKCEKLFRAAVYKKYPDHGVLGEEFGEKTGPSGWLWIIDPIDGTRAYSRGLPTWGTLITLVEESVPVVALADYPALDTTLWAVKGQGAWEGLPGQPGRAQKRLKVSRENSAQKSVVLHPGSNSFVNSKFEEPIRSLLGRCYLERSYGDCFAYWQMLKGAADLVLDFDVKIWDLAPFLLMTEEAGGKFTNFAGRRIWEGPTAVAGSRALVENFIARVRQSTSPLVKI